jgi:hypothetical protein
MTKISPEQLATRCITIAECYAFFRAMFKNPHDHNLIASPDELISNSKFIIELSNSLSDRIILLWCSMFGVDSEDGHWKKLIPINDHESFKKSIQLACFINEYEQKVFWDELTNFRIKYLAHSSIQTSWTHPNIDYCFSTATLFYNWINKDDCLTSINPTAPKSLRTVFEERRLEAKKEIEIGIRFDYEANKFE